MDNALVQRQSEGEAEGGREGERESTWALIVSTNTASNISRAASNRPVSYQMYCGLSPAKLCRPKLSDESAEPLRQAVS